MGEAKHKKMLEQMGYDGRLQYHADEVVKGAEPLVNLGAARWEQIEYIDGGLRVALVFHVKMWELKDNRLILKGGK